MKKNSLDVALSVDECRKYNCELVVEKSQKRCVCGCDYPGYRFEALAVCPACHGTIPEVSETCSHCQACLKKKYPCFGTAIAMFAPLAFMFKAFNAWTTTHIMAFSLLAFVCISSFCLGLMQAHRVKIAQSKGVFNFGLFVCSVLLVAVIMLGYLMMAAKY